MDHLLSKMRIYTGTENKLGAKKNSSKSLKQKK